MPELPEVEAYESYIEAHCLHKMITDIKILDKSVIQKISAVQFKKSLIDHEFTSVERLGKYLIIDVSDSEKKLVMHFGLTGSPVYRTDKTELVKYSRVQFIFKNAVLHWTDLRKFGKLWLVDDLQTITGLKKLGVDALAVTKKQFLALLSESQTKNIKAFLMDQSIIAGIGNEYSDEALFQAGIDPHHKINELSKVTCEKLYNMLHMVLLYAIKVQRKNSEGISSPTSLSKENRKSFPSSYLQAHRHIDMICPKNKKHTLKKATIAGRTTYYCPEDQK